MRRPGRAGGVRARNRERRTQQLTDAALQLFLRRNVDAVTIEDITRAAGVAKGSFYRYFENKEALVDALVEPLRATLLGAMDACRAALEQATDGEQLIAAYGIIGLAAAQLANESPDLVRFYLQECRAPRSGTRQPMRELADDISRRAIALTRAARNHGLLRTIHPAVSSLAVVGAAERLLLAYLSGEDLGDIAEVPGAVIGMVLDGIRER